MILKEKYSRRALLKAIGGGAALLPLLNNEAFGADGGSTAGMSASTGFPKRLITVTWTNGIYGCSKWSNTSQALTSANLPAIMSPLAPYVSKMILPRGVNLQAVFDKNQYGGHFGYPCILTGTQLGTSPSIDSLISTQLTTQGVVKPQLNIGALPEGSYTSWSTTGHNTQVTNPYTLFNQLFPSATMSTSQLSALSQRRASVLDLVTTQLTAFQNIVGTDDKVKIQSHLDSVRTLEMDLQAAVATCTPPSLTPQGLQFSGITNYTSQVNFMMRLAAAAVTCGISRAITIDLINDGGGDILTFPWLTPPITSPDYHALAHQGAAQATNKTAIDTWWYTQVATLASALAASTEGSSTSLDNSLILVCNDMREGNDHYSAGIAFVMIGSLGGYFNTGQQVGFSPAIPNNKLLTTICHGMGLQVAGVGEATYTGDVDSSLT
ncbi:MAG: DUF1552 domain-containing protein [Polyangiaceae bacterium]|jgi:hypothetical protein